MNFFKMQSMRSRALRMIVYIYAYFVGKVISFLCITELRFQNGI